MKPAELVAAARGFVGRSDGSLAGVWPRAAALTARQAIEAAMDQLWLRRAPGMEATSARAQLSCLTVYLGDADLAGDVAFTWAALSDACHHHDYELTPTAGELLARCDVVERLIARVDHLTA